MADGTTLNAGAGGDTIATDDIGGQKYQRIKLVEGADGVNDGDISSTNPLPAQDPNAHSADFDTGAGTDTTTAFGIAIPASGGAAVVPGGGGVEASALRVTIASDSTGVLSVDDNGGNISVDWNGTAPPIGAGTEAAALRVTVATDSTGVLSVDDNGANLSIDDGGNVITVDGSGSAGTAAAGVVTVQGIASMTPVQVSQATASNLNATVTLTAGTNTNEVVGDIAHDTAATTNPLPIAGIAQDIDDTAPPNQVSAENDTTRIATDRDGAVFTRPFGPRIWTYNATGVLTGAQVHAAPASGLALYITDIQFSINSATASSIKLLMNGGSDIWGPHYLEAIAGRGLSIKFQTPLKATAAGRVDVTTTGASTQSTSIQGFTAQG